MSRFHEIDPSLENIWRAIVLFGQNVASYKFALAKSLLELHNAGSDLVRLEDLAVPFSGHIAEHLRLADKQATSRSSRFLEACRKLNREELGRSELIDTTVRLGFANVIDAFHVVNREEVPFRFFVDERKTDGGIRLTDNLRRLAEATQFHSLPREVEARWRLVETAWELNISRTLIDVGFDAETEDLFVTQPIRRNTVTSCRDALNGYQKGRCFYCFDQISIVAKSETLADVDHFFPHILKKTHPPFAIDGVSNLALACTHCNRGEFGKMARVPALPLLERLHRRNEYLIASHHPLRATIIRQTGKSRTERERHLQRSYEHARQHLVHTWQPPAKGPELF